MPRLASRARRGSLSAAEVVDQSARLGTQNAFFEQRFDQRHFVGTGSWDLSAQRQTTAVDEDHDLGALATLGLTYAEAPFFAEENVPSAIASCQSMRPRRSSLRNSRAQAIFHRPASVQARKRRQQVGGDGKCAGRSLHRAPVRSTREYLRRTRVTCVVGGLPSRKAVRREINRQSVTIARR